MNENLENARNLYLRAIRDAEVDEVLENYMGETYRQHSTGVPDGKEGFAQFFNDFLNEILSEIFKLSVILLMETTFLCRFYKI